MKPECNLRSYDCYNEGTCRCWGCSYNKNAERDELADNYISIKDKVTELYEYLTDEKIPNGVCVKSRPKLSKNKAWSLIWFLQEVTHCLPDHIEKCNECDELFDSNREGFMLDNQYELNGKTLPRKYWGHYCDNCVPNIDFSLP